MTGRTSSPARRWPFAINPDLGSTIVDGDGSFAVTLTIPASLALGTYLLSASGEDANCVAVVAEATLIVTAAGAGDGDGDAPTLPRTGASSAPLAFGGLALAGVGDVLLRARRHAAA